MCAMDHQCVQWINNVSNGSPICAMDNGVDLFSGFWAKSGLGGKSDHGAKTLYVYLLRSSILYKNTLGGG